MQNLFSPIANALKLGGLEKIRRQGTPFHSHRIKQFFPDHIPKPEIVLTHDTGSDKQVKSPFWKLEHGQEKVLPELPAGWVAHALLEQENDNCTEFPSVRE